MVKIKVIGEFKQENTYKVRIGDMEKVLSYPDKSLDFEIADEGKYKLSIEKESPCIPLVLSVIINLITLVLQGIINIIFFNDNLNWEDDIEAYNIRGYCDLDLKGNEVIQIRIRESRYLKDKKLFSLPQVTVSPNTDFIVEILPNGNSISQRYNAFVKKVFSVGIIFYALFLYLLHVAFTIHNLWLCIFIMILIAGGTFIMCFSVFSARKKRNTLLNLFNEQETSRVMLDK